MALQYDKDEVSWFIQLMTIAGGLERYMKKSETTETTQSVTTQETNNE